ncbi:MAG: carboxypeptidase-like regulatory domain-containing protein [Planctomycetota bacterium]
MPHSPVLAVALLALALGAPLCAQEGAQKSVRKSRTIAGQVIDAAGKPAAGVTVKLVSGPYPGLPKVLHEFLPPRGPAFEVVTKTDDRGRFRITAKNRHTIGLHARRGDGEATEMSAVAVPVLPGDYRVLKLNKAATVSGVVSGVASGVASEDEDDQPIAGAKVHCWMGRMLPKKGITAGPERDLSIHPGTAVEGIVLGPDGKPVAGALLQDPYWPLDTARTNTKGRFKLALQRNRFWIHIFHPQLAHSVDYTRQVVRPMGLGRRAAKKAPDKDGKKAAQLRTLRLRTGARLKARVLGPGGRPLARARVVLAGMGKQLRNSSFLQKIVAWPWQLDEGGMLDVSCMHPGGVTYAYVEVDGEFVALFSGDVGRRTDLGDVKLRHQGALHGTVHLPSRMPAQGARVLLRRRFDRKPSSLRNASFVLPFLEVAADRAGRFQIAGLRPGAYDLAVDVRNHFPYVTKVHVSDDGKPVRIALQEGQTMRGMLVDADNKPVPHRGVRVYMQDNRVASTYRWLGFSMFQPVTDKHGRFVFHGLPKNRTFRINAYFILNGQTFRSNWIQNIAANADELELVLTTSMPQVAGGR